MTGGIWEDERVVWREVVDGLADGAVAVDLEGMIRYVNPAFAVMTGYRASELLGASAPFCFWPDEHRPAIAAAFARTLSGVRADLDLLFRRSNGEHFPVIVQPSAVRIGDQVVGYLATIKDMTERRELQSALARSEERWRSVAENPFDFVVTLDRGYRYTYVNHTAPGLNAEDLIGKATPFDFTAVEHHSEMRAAFDAAFDQKQAGFYEVYVSSLKRWYSTIVGPIVEEGEVTGVSLLTRDVTSQKQAESALRQAQRMETLGRLAGGIAHDFNNLLVPILGNAELMLGTLSQTDPRISLLEDISDAATRAQQLVSRVLLYGRVSTEVRERVRVQDVVREVIRFMRAALPQNVQFTLSLDDECPAVHAAPAELHQVVSNLCMNAVQALTPGGGTVRVKVARVVSAEDAPRVQLVVEDDGPGIAEDVASHVFEPFFTTREVGEGTGLGLSIVHSLASRYGGSVALHSVVPHGARFEVLLPAAPVSVASVSA